MTNEELKRIASRKQKKNIVVQYLNNDFQIEQNPSPSFSGYAVRTERSTLSNIKIFENGDEVGLISFRPTKQPSINVIRYKNYFEERYINGLISLQYTYYKDVLCGEYKKFDTDGTLRMREFYSGQGVCNQEIMDFIQFKGTEEDFMHYEFKEDEEFNILMKYGSRFKLIKELGNISQYFDKVFEKCYKGNVNVKEGKEK